MNRIKAKVFHNKNRLTHSVSHVHHKRAHKITEDQVGDAFAGKKNWWNYVVVILYGIKDKTDAFVLP